jgi:ADP-ribose pyrophosphatase
MSEAKRLSSTTAFSGRIFRVEVDRVLLPHGREASMEVVRHPASVVLVPMPDPDHVVLIRQYRYPVDKWLWELPAGTLEPGEALEPAAIRECHEEIGLVPAEVERLGSVLPTPGYCDEEMVIYKLTGLSEPTTEAAVDPDEVIEPTTVTVEEARAMVTRGEIVDMKTIVALALLRESRESGS